MNGAPPSDLRAVFVTYNTWRECAAAVRSLLAARPQGPDGRPLRCEVVVVDNASPQADAAGERELLEALAGGGGELRRSAHNRGYAGGVAFGAADNAAPLLLVANADVLFEAGAVDRLVGAVAADPAVAAAAPESFWDTGHTVRLPADHAPRPGDALAELASRCSEGIALRCARTRARRALRLADARPTAPLAMLSGHCLLLRSAAVAGAPFDERYPFYYEDADLAQRLRRAGHRLVQVQGARVVHLHDRSARTAPDVKRRGAETGRALYMRTWHGRAGLLADRCWRWLGDRAVVHRRAAALAERMPRLPLRGGRPVLELPRFVQRFVLLLGGDPWCSVPGIVIDSRSEWSPSDEVLAAIGDRDAFVHVFDAGDARLSVVASGRLRGQA